jgi:hypothetical protein
MPGDRKQRPVSSSPRAPEAEAGPGGAGGADAPGGAAAAARIEDQLQVIIRLLQQIAYQTSARNVEFETYVRHLDPAFTPLSVGAGRGPL